MLNQQLVSSLLRPWYLMGCSGQWLNLRLQIMGSFITAGTAAVAVYQFGGHHMNPAHAGLVGFTLLHALSITDLMNGFINTFTACENNLVAMERLDAMAQIEQEAPLLMDSDPPAGQGWPQQGVIEFDRVWMAYRPGLAPALRGVSFTAQAGEKVGIVGRRGAGKSSILIALFRLAETSCGPEGASGEIRLDGLNIRELGLATLRGGISIIPQAKTHDK